MELPRPEVVHERWKRFPTLIVGYYDEDTDRDEFVLTGFEDLRPHSTSATAAKIAWFAV